MASFKIAALQKALEDSVPASELDAMNKKYTELTEKYRDILGKSNNLVAKSEQNTGYEVRKFGNLNKIKKFFELAALVEAVMFTCFSDVYLFLMSFMCVQ